MPVNKVQQLFQLGMSYAKKKQFPLAIQAFSQAVELEPQNGAVYFYRGLCWAELEKFSRAEKDITQALRYDEKNPQAAYHLGVLLARRKEIDKALWCFTKAAELGHPKALEQASRLRLRLQGQNLPHEAPPSVEKQTALLFEKGSRLMEKGEWKAALQTFARLLALDEESWPAYGNRGAIYLFMGEPERAAAEFERAISLAPEQTAVYLNRARAYLKIGQLDKALADVNHILQKLRPPRQIGVQARLLRAQILREMGEFTQAAADLAVVEKDAPADTAVANEKGLLYLVQNDTVQAIANFQQALNHDPTFAAAHYHMGVAVAVQGDYEKAVQAFSQAITLAPDVAEYYVDRGVAYGRLQQNKKEIADFQKAIALQPQNATAHYNLGSALCSLRDYEAAIPHLTQAIERDPALLEAYTTRGTCYLQVGLPGNALQDYRAALHINPNDAVTRQNLFRILHDFQPEDNKQLALRGALYAEMNAFQEAVADFDELIRRDKGHSDAFRERGLAHMHLGNTEAAVQDFTRALRDFPNDHALLVNRANMFLGQEQFQRALRDAENAVAVAPREPLAHHALGNALSKLAQYREAILCYSEAIELAGENPNVALSYNSRGLAHAYLGNDEQALQDFQTAVQYNPNHGKAHYNIGGLLMSQEQYGPAVDAFLRAEALGYAPAAEVRAKAQARLAVVNREKEADLAIQQNPRAAAAYAERALVYAQTGRLAEAVPDIEQALKLDKKQSPAYVAQAIVLEHQGQTKQAFASLKKAISYNKQYGLAYVLQAELYQGHDQTAEALKTYETAVEAKVADPRPAYYLGNYHLHHGDLQAARPYLEKATVLDPNMGDAFFDLGSVYGRLGQIDQALACYARAADLGDGEAARIVEDLRRQIDAPIGTLADEPLGFGTVLSADELVQLAAQLLAKFAQDLCGNSVETRVQTKKGLFGRVKQEQVEVFKWRVDVEEMTIFDKSGQISAQPGATLSLPQRPAATVRLSVVDGSFFRLMLLAEIDVPGVNKQALASITKEDVPADPNQVRVRLHNLLQNGYLAIKNGRLLYTGKR